MCFIHLFYSKRLIHLPCVKLIPTFSQETTPKGVLMETHSTVHTHFFCHSFPAGHMDRGGFPKGTSRCFYGCLFMQHVVNYSAITLPLGYIWHPLNATCVVLMKLYDYTPANSADQQCLYSTLGGRFAWIFLIYVAWLNYICSPSMCNLFWLMCSFACQFECYSDLRC